jgi:hypothetical protein
MATVELIFKRYHTARIKSRVLYLERLLAVLRIGRQVPAILREAVVDTGAPTSVFPQKLWRVFQKEIRWLTKLNDPAAPPWCRQFSGAAGGVIPCRLGVVVIEIYGANLREKIGPGEIVAMFAHDQGDMKEDILFGLGGGTLAGRHLEVEYDRQKAILTETARRA